MLQVVDEVAHAGRLGFEIRVVVLVGGHLNGNACLHLNPPGPQPLDLERVVGHEPDALEPIDERQRGREGQAQEDTLKKTKHEAINIHVERETHEKSYQYDRTRQR